MTSRLNPYIAFTDNARTAMEFYKSVFGGNLTLNTFGDFGNPDPAVANLVMHAQLETDQGYTIMASDTAPGMPARTGSRITVSLSGDDAELRDYFAKLAEGGTIALPLEKQQWGDEFGMLTDQFGVDWMVNVSS
jgi:PhnB protein